MMQNRREHKKFDHLPKTDIETIDKYKDENDKLQKKLQDLVLKKKLFESTFFLIS